MSELQIVVSVLKTTVAITPKAFEVKMGLKTVGIVYLIPRTEDEDFASTFADLDAVDRDGTRWTWDSAQGRCSLDGVGDSLDGVGDTLTFGGRMEAVYALLGWVEKAAA